MHVVFDLDGVLLDSESDLRWLHRSLDATLTDYDIEPTDRNRSMLSPRNIHEFERSATELGVPVRELWDTRNEYYVEEKTRAIRSGEIGPYPDLEALFDIVRHHPISIISNSPLKVVEKFVETADLGSIIQYRIGRGNDLEAIERLKPASDFFEELHEQAGADEYVYVGDSADDARFADRTGMEFIALNREDGEISTLYGVKDRIGELR